MDSYTDFLQRKRPRAIERGIEVESVASFLFPYQQECVRFCLRVGSAGLFLDTGLGKTLCELEWAEHARHVTNRRALVLTPLAVAHQFAAEGVRFGYTTKVIRDQSEAIDGINICNYDRLDHLTPDEFGAVSLDESSILKNFTGKTSRALIAAFASHRFRLSATATPAPNDHMELGQHAEFCGVMSSSEMLSRFFINDTSTASQNWRLKRHGVTAFWDWMASWCRMAQMPSDLHDSDEGFILPPMNMTRHRVATVLAPPSDGLFAQDIVSATTMHDIKRQTAEERAGVAAQLAMSNAEPWVLWVDTDYEADAVLKHFPNRDNVREVRGSHSTDHKELIARWFTGEICLCRTQTTKSKQGANTCGAGLKTTKSTLPHTAEQTQTNETSGVAPNTQATVSTGKPSAEKLGNGGDATRQSSMLNDSANLDLRQRSSTQCSTSKADDVPSVAAKTMAIHAEDDSTLTIATKPDTSAGSSVSNATWGSASLETRQNFSIAQPCTCGHENGYRILISKPSIFGYGMNFQHCAHTAFVGRSFSYESWYQAVRRFWRFGQKRNVAVHIVVATGEDSIGQVIDRKAGDHDSMKSAMREAMRRNMGRRSQTKVAYEPTYEARLPQWLSAA